MHNETAPHLGAQLGYFDHTSKIERLGIRNAQQTAADPCGQPWQIAQLATARDVEAGRAHLRRAPRADAHARGTRYDGMHPRRVLRQRAQNTLRGDAYLVRCGGVRPSRAVHGASAKDALRNGARPARHTGKPARTSTRKDGPRSPSPPRTTWTDTKSSSTWASSPGKP